MVGHGNPKWPFLCDCSFHGSSWEIPSPKTACFVWSQSCPTKNKPHPETMCWKEFHLFHLPRLWTEATSCPHLFYAPQKFLCRNIFRSIWSILCTELWDVPCWLAAFLVDLLGLCWIATQSAFTASGDLTFRMSRCISSSTHSFLFILFEQAKYSVSQWCPTSSKNRLKFSLHDNSTFHFSQQNNNFGSLLNHKTTVIRDFNELLLWQLVQWFVRLNAT